MKTLEGLIWNGQKLEMPTLEVEINPIDGFVEDDMISSGGTIVASFTGSPNAGMTFSNLSQGRYSVPVSLDDEEDDLMTPYLHDEWY